MKPWYLSKTVWGAVILGLSQLVITLGTIFPGLEPLVPTIQQVLTFIGATFFGVGVRSAISTNGRGV